MAEWLGQQSSQGNCSQGLVTPREVSLKPTGDDSMSVLSASFLPSAPITVKTEMVPDSKGEYSSNKAVKGYLELRVVDVVEG